MLALRIIAAVIGALAAVRGLLLVAAAGWWVYRWDWIALALGAVFLLLGLLALWFAVLGDDEDERTHMKRTLLVGLGLGFAAFVAGFIGPMLLRPSANQGPLLGIFITGPAGFVLGCVGGFVWSRVRIA